jgi:hypothetical protein
MTTKPIASVIGVVLGGMLATTATGYDGNDAVTYYQDVRPILHANCEPCHRLSGKNSRGLVAPMPLTTYSETRPWASAIARQVEARQMPPWFASGPTGVFSNERGLTTKEIQTILAWVSVGAPAGDEARGPALRPLVDQVEDAWSLGKPDLVVKMPESYLIPDDAYDVGATFYTTLTAAVLPQDVWVRGWEIRPGTHGEVIHHMCVGVLPSGETPRPGGVGEDERGQLGCIAAGAEAAMLPACFGRLIPQGATIWFNVHYHKDSGPGTAVLNRAEIGFFLAKEPVTYFVKSDAIGNYGFEIPPHRSNYRIGAGRMLEKDTWVLSFWPHAHLRAKAARYTATYPDGREELLLDVPRYDQGWQVIYNYKTPKLLPSGTMVDVSFWYDNTLQRGARRGFDPDRALGNGPRTNDEMALGFISYAEVEPGTGMMACAATVEPRVEVRPR